MTKPKLGVFKFASCDGCQLSLLDLEDELLTLLGAVEIAHFPEASSNMNVHGPFDLALVEGSISTAEQLEELRAVREHSKVLITIGACASAGGVQALRNFADHSDFVRAVYATPDYIDSLETATPIADHVKVDFELRGCPISKSQLLELVSAFVVGRRPTIADESVCMECKRAGNVCVTVTTGAPCLGPVTQAGCGSLCPRFARGCFGCFGPKRAANTASLAADMGAKGADRDQLLRRFRLITGWAEPFAEESRKHE